MTNVNSITPTLNLSKNVGDDMINLLQKYRTCANAKQYHTHVLLESPYGTFTLPDGEMKHFWKLYVDCLLNKVPMFLAEAPSSESPVLADIDLKLTKSTANKFHVDKQIYTQNDVENIIKAYQQTLKTIIRDITDEALTCFLLEKSSYEKKIGGLEYVSNGFHLHFPYCFIDRRIQSAYLVPLVKSKIDNLFSGRYDDEITNNFIDANCMSVHWLMYGSKKGVGHDPYFVTKCYDSSTNQTDIKQALYNYKLPSLSSNRVRDEDSSSSSISITSSNIKRLLPRILSIKPYGREAYYFYRCKESINTPITDKYAERAKKRRPAENKRISEILKEVKCLLDLLSPHRADDRTFWRNVGYCLWNITDGDDEGFSMWNEFSESSDKYSEVECIAMWEEMRKSEFTIGTLKFYAKQDDPDGYRQLYASKVKDLVETDISHNSIAKVMYYEFGEEFVCASIDTRLWYVFKDHIWRVCDKGYGLREMISTNIHDKYYSLLSSKINRLQDNDDDDDDDDDHHHHICNVTDDENDNSINKKKNNKRKDEKEIKSFLKLLSTVSRDLKSAPYKNHIMTECCEVFYNPLFKNYLNKNPNLIAFKNGVYDFSTDKFRDGIPEDYLSVSLPIDYEDYGSPSNTKIIEIQEFFQEIFPDDDVRNYFLDQACQSFVGGNNDKVFLIWTGTGNNGKTVTQTLFEKMFGNLAIKFSTSLITGKKQQIGVASPELARGGDGVRWAVMDEPNQDEVINAGILKALTGNDSYWARDLFEKGKETREITPLFKLHMICNRLPRMSRDADSAAWGRIRVIPFESQFVTDGYPTTHCERMKQKIFPIDTNMNERLDSMLKPLVWFLIRRWRMGEWKDRPVPDKVKVATAIYHRENDMFTQFIEECIYKLCDDDNDQQIITTSFDSVYTAFKSWFRDEYPNQQIPQRTTTKHNLVIALKRDLVDGKYWQGIKLISNFTTKITKSNPLL